jgi:hypothetical protein
MTIGNEAIRFSATATSPALARFFLDQGGMVALPERRGFAMPRLILALSAAC